ncbi:MAG: glutathione S-transferase N-terminal domain-containing protein [Candidatus Omnitrophica bacterium]|nr:glutathione S-transferase N-terminal domain-containing protein [Candidatus Omnitrophota bacterium]
MKNVKVYGASTCPYCAQVKQFLKDNNVEFEYADVSSDQAAAREMMDKSGQMGLPALDIGGEIIVGFEREKIKSVLGL